jgi:hypothetical protein
MNIVLCQSHCSSSHVSLCLSQRKRWHTVGDCSRYHKEYLNDGISEFDKHGTPSIGGIELFLFDEQDCLSEQYYVNSTGEQCSTAESVFLLSRILFPSALPKAEVAYCW